MRQWRLRKGKKTFLMPFEELVTVSKLEYKISDPNLMLFYYTR